MASVIAGIEGCAIATSTTSRMKDGMVWNRAITRPSARSIRPPA